MAARALQPPGEAVLMPRGVSRRAELAPVARELRAQGLTFREIAERLGVGAQAVSEWINDPDRAKHAARRARYAGRCGDCGGRTDGSDGPGRAPKLCAGCTRRRSHEQARAGVIAAIQRWGDEHGGVPPTATDWNVADARAKGHPEKAEKFYRDGCWPHASSVVLVFGSWNAGLLAAGFEPLRVPLRGEALGRRCAEVAARYDAGEGVVALAGEYGCDAASITYWARRGGARIRSRSEAQLLRCQREREKAA